MRIPVGVPQILLHMVGNVPRVVSALQIHDDRRRSTNNRAGSGQQARQQARNLEASKQASKRRHNNKPQWRAKPCVMEPHRTAPQRNAPHRPSHGSRTPGAGGTRCQNATFELRAPHAHVHVHVPRPCPMSTQASRPACQPAIGHGTSAGGAAMRKRWKRRRCCQIVCGAGAKSI